MAKEGINPPLLLAPLEGLKLVTLIVAESIFKPFKLDSNPSFTASESFAISPVGFSNAAALVLVALSSKVFCAVFKTLSVLLADKDSASFLANSLLAIEGVLPVGNSCST